MSGNEIKVDATLRDRRWRGYNPRAAVPIIALATAVSAVLLAGRWYLDDFTAAIVPYTIVLALWPGLLGIAIYRAITYTYRVTGRALFVDRGFRNPPVAPLWLKDVKSVEPGANWLSRRLGIGWLRVTSVEGRELLLTALRSPEEFAIWLRDLAARAKEIPAEPAGRESSV